MRPPSSSSLGGRGLKISEVFPEGEVSEIFILVGGGEGYIVGGLILLEGGQVTLM